MVILVMHLSFWSQDKEEFEDTKRGNQYPQIEGGQTTQWQKQGQRDKHYTSDLATPTLLNTEGELRGFW